MKNEIKTSNVKEATTIKRSSMRGVLRHVQALGFAPATIIDVGVNTGTPQLYDTYPAARYILIDPLEENRCYIEKICRTLGNAEYIIAAATASPSELVFHVHRDFAGSSLYLESDGNNADGIQRIVPGLPLDSIMIDKKLTGPFIIKIDTQGSELDVLKGAGQLLPETELIILETTLFQFHVQGPQFYDVVAFMKNRGYVVYDIMDGSYRPIDGALAQVDLAFVKENGLFRQTHCYASTEQREEMASRILAKRQKS